MRTRIAKKVWKALLAGPCCHRESTGREAIKAMRRHERRCERSACWCRAPARRELAGLELELSILYEADSDHRTTSYALGGGYR